MSKNNIDRGGVIPYYIADNGDIMMMFMKPSDSRYGGKEFQIAKGKIEEGESIEDGAFREAAEELGLFIPNTRNHKLLGTFLGRTTVYLAEVIDKDKFGDPTDETSDVAWMTPEQFQSEGRDLHKPIVKAALRAIQH